MLRSGGSNSGSSSYVPRKIDFSVASDSSSNEDVNVEDNTSSAGSVSPPNMSGHKENVLPGANQYKKSAERIPRRLSSALSLSKVTEDKDTPCPGSPRSCKNASYVPKKLDFTTTAESSSSSDSDSKAKKSALLMLNNNSPRNEQQKFRRPTDISTPLRSGGEVPKMAFKTKNKTQLFPEDGNSSREDEGAAVADRISPINGAVPQMKKPRLLFAGERPMPVIDSKIISAANKRRQSAPAAGSNLALKTPMPLGRARSRIAMMNASAEKTPDEKNNSSTASEAGGASAAFEDPERKNRGSRLANINPYTPTVLLETSIRKRSRSQMAAAAGVPLAAVANGAQNNDGSFTPTTNIVNYTHEDIQRTLERLNNSRAVGAAAAAIGTRTPTTSSGVVAPNGHGGSFNRSASFVAPYLNGGLNGNVADDEDDEDDEDVDCSNHLPSKRIKMSDVNITRYCEEFLEVSEIANGEFGKVTVVRHRLDGMLYAIKVTRHPIQNSAQERTAMNEVFAHAALMKHKHVVRYYNSWVEAGRVYIQNEYCEGGSLADVIRVRREQGRIFAESELKRILLHLAKGLRYIHSKRLVHLDIKPENIFLSFDLVSSSSPSGEEEEGGEVTATDAIGTPSKKIVVVKKAVETATQTSDVEMKEPQPEASKESAPAAASSADTEDSSSQKVLMNTIHDSTDSGHASGNNAEQQLVAAISQRGDGLERVSYKIGDLGHVAPTTCEYVPEEGDCRYMAPELLLHTVDREKLPKADVFSLGLTLFECATLTEMPKNSMEDPMFERLQEGRLPYLPRYSKEFNALLKTMVLPDVLARPSCSRLVNHPYLKASNASSKAVSRMRTSNLQLHKELQIARNRFKELEILYEAQKQAAASRKAAAKAAAAAKAKAKQTLKTLRGDAAG